MYYLVFLLSSSLFASSITVNKEVRLDTKPTFFFKVSPDGKYLSYTLPSKPDRPQAGGKNYILEVENNKKTQIPGPWDPVFNVGSEFITLPKRGGGRNVYYEFYTVKSVLENGLNASAIGYDSGLSGLYQSVGKLAETSEYVDYRIITEGSGNHAMRDYRFYRRGEVKTLGSEKSLCYGKNLKLPMISKDGQELGALDLSTGKTTIFKVAKDGACSKLFDLGNKFGKVNFSHDSRKLTFHKYNSSEPRITKGYVAIPDSSTTSDIYVYDRDIKKLYRLTSNRKSNALYPDFLLSGEIVYASYPHNKSYVNFMYVSANLVSINNKKQFFKHLPKDLKSKKAYDFIKSNLISNDAIKIKRVGDFQDYLSTVREAGLLWDFIQKSAKDGLSLRKSGILESSLQTYDKEMLDFILSENQFKDYNETISFLLSNIIERTLRVDEEASSEFVLFCAINENVKIESIDLYKNFLNRYSAEEDLLIDILSKLRRSKFTLSDLDVSVYLTNSYSMKVHSAILRLRKMAGFKKMMNTFFLGTAYKSLGSNERFNIIKRVIRDHSLDLNSSLIELFLEEDLNDKVLLGILRSKNFPKEGAILKRLLSKLSLEKQEEFFKNLSLHSIISFYQSGDYKEVVLKALGDSYSFVSLSDAVSVAKNNNMPDFMKAFFAARTSSSAKLFMAIIKRDISLNYEQVKTFLNVVKPMVNSTQGDLMRILRNSGMRRSNKSMFRLLKFYIKGNY